jgi:hypothetical protein
VGNLYIYRYIICIDCTLFGTYLSIIKEQAFVGGACVCHGHFGGGACVCVNTGSSPKAFMEHAQPCPNKSSPDVIAVMTQSLMTQQPASPPDDYSITVMTQSSKIFNKYTVTRRVSIHVFFAGMGGFSTRLPTRWLIKYSIAH